VQGARSLPEPLHLNVVTNESGDGEQSWTVTKRVSTRDIPNRRPCSSRENQVWSIEPGDDGYYSRLVSRQSGKCLDVSGASTEDGAPIILWQCHGGANQQWRLEPFGEEYRLVARHSGKCLDVTGWSPENGTRIIQWQCNGGANQTWLIRPR
jgi:ricin-type beta-trefoil lectin protein